MAVACIENVIVPGIAECLMGSKVEVAGYYVQNYRKYFHA